MATKKKTKKKQAKSMRTAGKKVAPMKKAVKKKLAKKRVSPNKKLAKKKAPPRKAEVKTKAGSKKTTGGQAIGRFAGIVQHPRCGFGECGRVARGRKRVRGRRGEGRGGRR